MLIKLAANLIYEAKVIDHKAIVKTYIDKYHINCHTNYSRD